MKSHQNQLDNTFTKNLEKEPPFLIISQEMLKGLSKFDYDLEIFKQHFYHKLLTQLDIAIPELIVGLNNLKKEIDSIHTDIAFFKNYDLYRQWQKTAEDCAALLNNLFDEKHLDHDYCYQKYVQPLVDTFWQYKYQFEQAYYHYHRKYFPQINLPTFENFQREFRYQASSVPAPLPPEDTNYDLKFCSDAFIELYNAAKNYKEENKESHKKVEKILQKTCIDIREGNERFNTVAGRLAREGHIDSAKWLIYNFGAAVEFVVYGCRQGGYLTEALSLAAEFKIDVNCTITTGIKAYTNAYVCERYRDDHYYAALRAGDIEYADHLYWEYSLSNLFHDNEMEHLARGGHLYQMERYATGFWWSRNLHWGIGHTLRGEKTNNVDETPTYRFRNEVLALHSLSFIKNNKFLDQLIIPFCVYSIVAWEDDGSLIVDYPLREVKERSKKIRAIMQEYKLPYNKALIFLQEPTMRISMLKIQFLEDHYKIKEEHANLWFNNATFRYWFRHWDHFPFPMEIHQKITRYVLNIHTEEALDEFNEKLGFNHWCRLQLCFFNLDTMCDKERFRPEESFIRRLEK